MSYEVVARRWRPLTFASVVGQSHVTQTLANAVQRDRIPHAILLTGTRGVGKTTIARLLARAINCTARGEGAEPCNECPSCKQNLAGSSLDIIEIDGASNNGVDEVRDLIESAQYRPSAGRFKVYIIDEVHQLTKSAFNALLKTLEEPPSHVKFVMATTEAHKLPPTVLSRCQRYDFRRLSDDELSKQLTRIAKKDGMEISPDAVALLAREADGSMRDAQSLLEQVMAGAQGALGADEVAQLLGVAGADLVASCVEAILLGDAARIVDQIGEVKRYGYDLERLLGEILEALRHVTVATVAGAKSLAPSVPAAHRELAARLEKKRSALDLQRIFASLLDTAGDLRRGGHPDLVLEMGLLKVASLEPVETATALLARLGVLESGGSMPPRSGPGGPSGPRSAPPQRTAAPPPQAPPRRESASPRESAPQRDAAPPRQSPPPPRDDQRRGDTPSRGDAAPSERPGRLPLAGKPNPAAVESWSGPEGEPVEPLSDADAAERRWEAFLDDVKKRYGLDLYVTVTNCRLAALTAEHLDLAPTSDTFVRNLRNPTTMARVTEVARVHYGENIDVRLAGDSAPAAGLSLQGIQDGRNAKKKATALSDPFVDKLVTDLGGRVTKVSIAED